MEGIGEKRQGLEKARSGQNGRQQGREEGEIDLSWAQSTFLDQIYVSYKVGIGPSRPTSMDLGLGKHLKAKIPPLGYSGCPVGTTALPQMELISIGLSLTNAKHHHSSSNWYPNNMNSHNSVSSSSSLFTRKDYPKPVAINIFHRHVNNVPVLTST